MSPPNDPRRPLVLIDPPYRVVGDDGSRPRHRSPFDDRGDDRDGDLPPPRPRPRWKLPLVLFVLTCASTLFVGFTMHASSDALQSCIDSFETTEAASTSTGDGACGAYLRSSDFRTDLGLGGLYAGALLLILLAHEMGHYIQALRYRVPTSLPYFIPLPLPPFGTMGALLAMRPRTARHQGLFDVAVSGPLAGLVPTLLFTWLGLQRSEIVPLDPVSLDPEGVGGGLTFAVPPLFEWLMRLAIDIPPDHTILMHPLTYAGWVGLFITALNLLPIGQLDGGHILYTLVPKHAHRISTMLVAAWIVVIVWQGYWQWSLMIVLLVFLGLRHPPLARGSSQLGWGRRALGIAVLALVPLSFNLDPIRVEEPASIEEPAAEEPADPEIVPAPGDSIAALLKDHPLRCS